MNIATIIAVAVVEACGAEGVTEALVAVRNCSTRATVELVRSCSSFVVVVDIVELMVAELG